MLIKSADMHPHYTLAGLIALGLDGIEKKMKLTIPPLCPKSTGDLNGERLPKSLGDANERFMAANSKARQVLGDVFVDHFGGTREHELREW